VVRKQKKKYPTKNKQKPETTQLSTNEILSQTEFDSENIIRLKLTTRKGTRIESVPVKKLEKLATNKNLYWKLKDNWLILIGLS
jgi:hypothetical protein